MDFVGGVYTRYTKTLTVAIPQGIYAPDEIAERISECNYFLREFDNGSADINAFWSIILFTQLSTLQLNYLAVIIILCTN
jgi:hypothetical protein